MPHDCAGPAVNPFRLFGILSSPGWPCLIPILDAAPLVDDEALGQLGLGILVRLVADRTWISRRTALTAARAVDPRPIGMGLADPAGIVAAGAITHVFEIEIGGARTKARSQVNSAAPVSVSFT